VSTKPSNTPFMTPSSPSSLTNPYPAIINSDPPTAQHMP
jgi:hypothetical protein